MYQHYVSKKTGEKPEVKSTWPLHTCNFFGISCETTYITHFISEFGDCHTLKQQDRDKYLLQILGFDHRLVYMIIWHNRIINLK